MDAQKMVPLLEGLLCILVLTTMPSAAEGTARLSRWIVRYELTPPVGYRKLSITINGQTPAPTIPAYQGDMFVIEVTNGLRKEDLAIEFDGVRPVGGASTHPIRPGETFAYRFFVDRLGDCPYRARSKLQEVAGLHGSIRVLPRDQGKKGVGFEDPRPVKGSGEIKDSERP